MNDPVQQWLTDPWLLNFLIGVASLHPLWRIFRRAGLPPWPALLILVPIVGCPLVGSILAFRHWPDIVPRKKEKR